MDIIDITYIFGLITWVVGFAWNVAISLWAVMGIDLVAMLISAFTAIFFVSIFYKIGNSWTGELFKGLYPKKEKKGDKK